MDNRPLILVDEIEVAYVITEYGYHDLSEYIDDVNDACVLGPVYELRGDTFTPDHPAWEAWGRSRARFVEPSPAAGASTEAPPGLYEFVVCEACGGEGEHARVHSRGYGHNIATYTEWEDCDACHGDGGRYERKGSTNGHNN